MCEETVLSKVAWKAAIGATNEPKRLMLLSHNGLFIRPAVFVKANHIEVDVVFVNMFLQNMVAIAALKKNQLLLKLFLNLVHVQTTINFLHK